MHFASWTVGVRDKLLSGSARICLCAFVLSSCTPSEVGPVPIALGPIEANGNRQAIRAVAVPAGMHVTFCFCQEQGFPIVDSVSDRIAAEASYLLVKRRYDASLKVVAHTTTGHQRVYSGLLGQYGGLDKAGRFDLCVGAVPNPADQDLEIAAISVIDAGGVGYKPFGCLWINRFNMK
jgi:hypothetical protein